MLACQTQWRVGFAGATGLDYNALFSVAGALGIQVDAVVLRGIGFLECLTLEKWRKDSEAKKRSAARNQAQA
jgi:hypothetical protein